MTVLKCEVYARVIDNEPSFHQDISIRLLPTDRILRLAKKEVGFQTKYVIELQDPQKLCTIVSDAEAKSALRDVILAVNLLLERVALSRRPLYPYSEPQIIQDEPTLKDSDSYKDVEILQSIESNGSVSNSIIAAGEEVSITDVVYMSFKAQPIELEEERILRTFGLVHQLGKGISQSARPRGLHNLADSLKDFEKAMDHPELSEIFKSLFIAFEKAINYKKETQGEKFDNAAATLTNSSTDDVKRLRQAYDRFKHSDKTPEQVQKTLECTKELPGLIRTLKPMAGEAILSRLKLAQGNP